MVQLYHVPSFPLIVLLKYLVFQESIDMDVALWVLGEWCKYNVGEQLSFQAEECRR